MGVVYLAERLELRRPTAIKVLADHLYADPDTLMRFRQEAELLARIKHPGIVQIYDIGQAAGRAYLALEYVSGGSLADYCRDRVLSPEEAVRLIEQIARAVDAAHRMGIVHRDLKPGNILLDGDQPKVTDFGLARALDTADCRTVSGTILGTPRYMAPEQAAGESGSHSPATDVYALGVILYEMLAGRPPIEGSSFLETLQRITTCQPERLRQWVPTLPPLLDEICMKCLRKDPVERFDTAIALAEQLARVRFDDLHVGPERFGSTERAGPSATRPAAFLSRPSTLGEETPKGGLWWTHRLTRRPVIAAFLLVVLVVVFASVAGWRLLSHGPDHDPLPLHSQWKGTFAFLPGSLATPDADVQIHITLRDGDRFQGVYETERQVYAWRIDGFLTGTRIRWEFIEAIRDNDTHDVVGNAFVEGILEAQIMNLEFHQRQDGSAAVMQLKRID